MKVQQKKDEQGYTKEPACCKNCSKFLSQMVDRKSSWSYTVITEEKNKRCGIGGFKVNSTGWCRLFERSGVKS